MRPIIIAKLFLAAVMYFMAYCMIVVYKTADEQIAEAMKNLQKQNGISQLSAKCSQDE